MVQKKSSGMWFSISIVSVFFRPGTDIAFIGWCIALSYLHGCLQIIARCPKRIQLLHLTCELARAASCFTLSEALGCLGIGSISCCGCRRVTIFQIRWVLVVWHCLCPVRLPFSSLNLTNFLTKWSSFSIVGDSAALLVANVHVGPSL